MNSDEEREEVVPRRNVVQLLLPIVFIGALLLLLLLAVLRPAGSQALVPIDAPAPVTSLALYSGGIFHLSAVRGRTVVVNFWWSGCQPCKDEAGLLQSAWTRWRGRGVVFLGIDENDVPTAAEAFLRTYAVTYPNGADPGDLDIQYHTTGQPETFFISPRGTIKVKYAQPFPDATAIDRLIESARA